MPQSSPSTSVRFDRAADYYDATRGYPAGVPGRIGSALAEVAGLGAESRVLEIGIGTGRIALPLGDHVARVAGIDLAPPMLAKLRAKPGGAAIWLARGDATRLPFADASFDAILAVHVFHLIDGWPRALDEVARVLKPGAPLLSGFDSRSFEALWNALDASAPVPPATGVPRNRIERFLDEAGWTSQGRREVPFATTTHLREAVGQLESRTWSSTWNLDDEQLAGLVRLASEKLEQHYGSLDQEVTQERRFRVEAYLPPG